MFFLIWLRCNFGSNSSVVSTSCLCSNHVINVISFLTEIPETVVRSRRLGFAASDVHCLRNIGLRGSLANSDYPFEVSAGCVVETPASPEDINRFVFWNSCYRGIETRTAETSVKETTTAWVLHAVCFVIRPRLCRLFLVFHPFVILVMLLIFSCFLHYSSFPIPLRLLLPLIIVIFFVTLLFF
jgi:hypothetical protein